MSEIVDRYIAEGSTPTVVPAGANCNAAVHGPIGLGVEISRQEQDLGVSFSHVVLGVASGGTYAGLQLSVLKHPGRWTVKAVRTDDYDDDYYQRIYAEKRAFLNILPEDEARLPSRLELFGGAVLGDTVSTPMKTSRKCSGWRPPAESSSVQPTPTRRF